jgi:hypothetical protein
LAGYKSGTRRGMFLALFVFARGFLPGGAKIDPITTEEKADPDCCSRPGSNTKE